MKRTLAIVLALMMVFCLFAACGEKKAAETTTSGTEQTTQSGTQQGSTSTSTEQVGGKGTNENAITQGGSSVAVDETGARLNYSRYELTQMETFPSDDAHVNLTYEVTFKGVGGMGHGSDRSYLGMFTFEQLFDWDSINNTPTPFLAESYEWVADNVVRLKIHDGVYTPNGDKFTASDALWTMKTQKELGLLNAYYSVIRNAFKHIFMFTEETLFP